MAFFWATSLQIANPILSQILRTWRLANVNLRALFRWLYWSGQKPEQNQRGRTKLGHKHYSQLPPVSYLLAVSYNSDPDVLEGSSSKNKIEDKTLSIIISVFFPVFGP